MSMKRIHRLRSEHCRALLALLALTNCTGQDKDLGASERSLEEGPHATANEHSSGPSDAGAQGAASPAATPDSAAADETSSAAAPVNLDPVPEMPSAAEDAAAPQGGDNSDPDVDESEPAHADGTEGNPTPAATEPDAGEAPQNDGVNEPGEVNDDPADEAAPSVEETAEVDAGAGEPGPEFGPPPLVYRGGGGGSFSMCSDVVFEEAIEPGPVPEQLLGVWTGDIEASALDLPSGSGLVTLTLTEEGATLVFGEVEDTGLIPAPWPPYTGPREGFVYTVPLGAVAQDVEFEGESYELTVDFTLSQNEPLEPHCQARHPSPVSGEAGCYTCLPAVISSWETFESDANGMCRVDDKYSLPCSELGLCWQDCLCDAESCHYRPGYVSQLRLNAEGQLALPIDYYWLAYGDGFTSNAPGDALWATLQRQP